MSNSHLAILMCTFNGESYIDEQLSSITKQDFKNWHLWISDDKSSDNTLNIIKSHLGYLSGDITVLSGPARGFSENFKSLIHYSPVSSHYYAFADQDDIWLSDKLTRAVKWLDEIPENTPAMYCSRTELIDEEGKVIGYSPDYTKPPALRNALLQNIASGNTMVFNDCALKLLRQATSGSFVIHDWALYLAVTACGGRVYFDHQPSVRYRQHRDNLIGNGMSLLRRLNNFFQACKGRKAEWNDKNCAMLENLSFFMTDESKEILRFYSSIRDKNIFERYVNLRKSGVYHQQRIGMLTTIAHTLLNRM